MENFIQLTLPDLTSLALNPMNFQCYEYRTKENILYDLFNFYKVIRYRREDYSGIDSMDNWTS